MAQLPRSKVEVVLLPLSVIANSSHSLHLSNGGRTGHNFARDRGGELGSGGRFVFYHQ